jgi:hypothetical protein
MSTQDIERAEISLSPADVVAKLRTELILARAKIEVLKSDLSRRPEVYDPARNEMG